MAPTDLKRVVVYVRVSSAGQADSGAGLAAQQQAIMAEAQHRHWYIVQVYRDAGVSAKNVAAQPQLQAALAALKAHHADAIVVAKLDRLTRSLGDFANLLERSVKEGWAVVALDLSIDTSTPTGEYVANNMAALARWERRLIGQRTKDALAVKRTQGTRLGRPPYLSPDAARWIMTRYGKLGPGRGVQARLVRELDARASKDQRYAPPHGGRRWRRSTVHDIVARTQSGHRQLTPSGTPKIALREVQSESGRRV
jgi:DNA invertase Pin-like site-specific DNA recombinase